MDKLLISIFLISINFTIYKYKAQKKMALIVILGERKFKKCFRKGENIFQKELNVLSNGRDVSLIESAFLGLPLFLLALSGPGPSETFWAFLCCRLARANSITCSILNSPNIIRGFCLFPIKLLDQVPTPFTDWTWHSFPGNSEKKISCFFYKSMLWSICCMQAHFISKTPWFWFFLCYENGSTRKSRSYSA